MTYRNKKQFLINFFYYGILLAGFVVYMVTTVLNMKKLSESVIKFETQNTRYLLHLTSDTKKAVTV